MNNHMKCFGIFLVFLFLCSACAFVNVPLTQHNMPLVEQVIEGEGKPKILLLDISGLISEKEKSGGGLMQEKPSMVAEIKESLMRAENDAGIAGVILRINSPGGTVTASDIIYHELVKFKSRKKVPVYACITGLGASGAYYIAVAADQIFAQPTSVTGSIGVITMKFNVEQLMAKIGVGEETIKSGDKKDIMSPFRQSTPEEKEIMQTIIKKMYSRFLDVVLAHRQNRLSRKELETLADGRVYTADQALAGKLIDAIGYMDDAVKNMKKSLNIEQARVVCYTRPGAYKGTIYSAGDAAVSPNLIDSAKSSLYEMFSGTEFLYLWKP